MIINLSQELEARMHEWGREFHRPCEDLAVELLKEYFEDSDTGARIAEAVKTVGDYRIICEIQDNVLIILVLEIGHRGDGGDKKPQKNLTRKSRAIKIHVERKIF